MSDAIVLEKVTRSFGSFVAVRDLDLVIPRGKMYGFIGPNGAGKTTTIRMIMSILFPDSGRIEVLGHASALEAKDRIGYLPEERGVYKKMRVGAFLTYIARLKGQDGGNLGRRVGDWLDKVELKDVAGKRCEELSKGMQQKVQFIAAVIHEPELLILDEPFSGLDPVNMRLLRELILEQHRRGATIIFSTHVMAQAEQICDHVVMIHKGSKRLDDTMRGIRAKFDPRAILFEPLDPAASLAPIEALPSVSSVARTGDVYEISVRDGVDPAQAIQAVATAVPPARLELRRPTLEDVFVRIVSDEEGEAVSLREALRAGAVAEARA
jgi:ABC-2 type transport system ATP-binding protein